LVSAVSGAGKLPGATAEPPHKIQGPIAIASQPGTSVLYSVFSIQYSELGIQELLNFPGY